MADVYKIRIYTILMSCSECIVCGVLISFVRMRKKFNFKVNTHKKWYIQILRQNVEYYNKLRNRMCSLNRNP